MWQTDSVCPSGPRPWNLVKGKVRAGRDDEIVVVDASAIGQFDPVFSRMNRGRHPASSGRCRAGP